MKTAVNQLHDTFEASSLIEGVKVGTVVSIDDHNNVFVKFPGFECKNLHARFVKSIKWSDMIAAAKKQQEVLLAFENGEPTKPIIIDILSPISKNIQEVSRSNTSSDKENEDLQEVSIDGKRIAFTAKEQITLKCGKASITLTKAGKVMVKGAYVLNRSSGAMRIKGGSVQIN